jgi:hypothetical protein
MDLMTPTYYVDVKYELADEGERWSCVHTVSDGAPLSRVMDSVEHFKAKGHEVRVRMRSEQVIL